MYDQSIEQKIVPFIISLSGPTPPGLTEEIVTELRLLTAIYPLYWQAKLLQYTDTLATSGSKLQHLRYIR